MATQLIYIPLSVTASSHRAAQVGNILVHSQNTHLERYNQLRSEGWIIDSTSPVVLTSGAFLAVVMHRPDKLPLTISQEYNEAYRGLCELERTLEITVSDDATLNQHILAVVDAQAQRIKALQAQLATMQPIGELNGTEEA